MTHWRVEIQKTETLYLIRLLLLLLLVILEFTRDALNIVKFEKIQWSKLEGIGGSKSGLQILTWALSCKLEIVQIEAEIISLSTISTFLYFINRIQGMLFHCYSIRNKPRPLQPPETDLLPLRWFELCSNTIKIRFINFFNMIRPIYFLRYIQIRASWTLLSVICKYVSRQIIFWSSLIIEPYFFL